MSIITPKFWRRFMRIDEIKQYDKDGNCIWEADNIPNMLHLEGEEFILQLAFDQSAGAVVPSQYYIGLDSRPTVSATDDLLSITGEPTTFGYDRQPVSSTTGFSITNVSNTMKAASSIVSFLAIGGGWGPVTNVFLATSDDNSGLLISTATMTTPRTLTDGQTFSLRISISLTQC